MFKKLLIALAAISLAVVPSQAAHAAAPKPPKANIHLTAVRDIQCGKASGTASLVSQDGLFVTAYHVVGENKTCTDIVSGEVYKVTFTDYATDFATLKSDNIDDDRFVPIDCSGFKTGKTYYLMGYAWGYDFRVDKVIATKKYTDKAFLVEGATREGLRQLKGVLIMGQSGGPVMDLETGKMVGINNVTFPWKDAYSRELKSTPLCKKS